MISFYKIRVITDHAPHFVGGASLSWPFDSIRRRRKKYSARIQIVLHFYRISTMIASTSAVLTELFRNSPNPNRFFSRMCLDGLKIFLFDGIDGVVGHRCKYALISIGLSSFYSLDVCVLIAPK